VQGKTGFETLIFEEHDLDFEKKNQLVDENLEYNDEREASWLLVDFFFCCC
jgi:hypothetical protein